MKRIKLFFQALFCSRPGTVSLDYMLSVVNGRKDGKVDGI